MTFQMVWPEETFITAFKFTLVWPLQGKEKKFEFITTCMLLDKSDNEPVDSTVTCTRIF